MTPGDPVRVFTCVAILLCVSAKSATIISLERLDSDMSFADESVFTAPSFGGPMYQDYTFVYLTWLPYLVGADVVRMVNLDFADPDYQLQLTLATTATVYLMIDDRLGDISVAMPWVIADGFQDTGDNMPASDMTLSVYAKTVPAGTVILREQDVQTGNMYTVAVVPEPGASLLMAAGAGIGLGVRARSRRG